MKAIMAVSAVCIALGLGFLLCHRSPAGPDETVSETPAATQAARVAPSSSPRSPLAVAAAANDPCMTKEEFEQLPPEGQNKAMQEFIAAFWGRESAGTPGEVPQANHYLSLEMFERPYMRTITEGELAKLSPQDREKAIAETHESCTQTRSHVTDAVAQAQASMARGDHLRAEAQLISALETGRELSANQDGLLITRLTGLACQKVALKEMTTLYTKTGDAPKMQTTQRQLGDIDAQAAEIRSAAQQQ
jgi:hypothetical protein